MPNVNQNQVTIPENVLYGSVKILKVLNIVISEDQADQYVILLDNGEKALISKDDLTQVQAGTNLPEPITTPEQPEQPEQPVTGGS